MIPICSIFRYFNVTARTVWYVNWLRWSVEFFKTVDFSGGAANNILRNQSLCASLDRLMYRTIINNIQPVAALNNTVTRDIVIITITIPSGIVPRTSRALINSRPFLVMMRRLGEKHRRVAFRGRRGRRRYHIFKKQRRAPAAHRGVRARRTETILFWRFRQRPQRIPVGFIEQQAVRVTFFVRVRRVVLDGAVVGDRVMLRGVGRFEYHRG